MNHAVSQRRRRPAGFTLIELMIALVVVAIIAAIAYPSYQDSVRKSRRAEAKAAVNDLAARLEQFFLDNKTYSDDFPTLNANDTTEHGYYTLEIDPGGTGDIASSYLITATAVGVQASDTKCATFTMSSTGAKASTPAGNSCW
jgi:type IV pilus assembly protein PilE